VFEFEERSRWSFQPPPDETLFARPGLVFAEADRSMARDLSTRFRRVEEIGRLSRMFGNERVTDFVLFRVSDPIGPVLAR
jgi:hypothetical protein